MMPSREDFVLRDRRAFKYLSSPYSDRLLGGVQTESNDVNAK
jgi:hypothetical protein